MSPMTSSSTLPAGSDTIAAIDIGTNSIHLVVARMDDSGHMKILDMDKVAVRLGEAIAPHGAIQRDGIQRTVETLTHMQEIASAYDCRVRAVATHATREATNYHELLDAVLDRTGIRVEVIDGIEEARLVFLGMRQGLHLDGHACLGVDIGGGSTEIIIARGDEVRFVTSLKLGAVTLSHKHCGAKGPSPKDIKALYSDIRQRLAPLFKEAKHLKFSRAIASSGTAKAIATINQATGRARDVADANGFPIAAASLEKVSERLEILRAPSRIREVMGIESARADIILAGAAILRCITDAFGVDEWITSSYGLREGLVVDTWRRSVPERVSHAPNVRLRSVNEFARRVGIDEEHASAVVRIAESLFDQVAERILGERSRMDLPLLRELLGVAARLHEAGKFVSIPGYHKHTFYLISNSRLMGFTQDERQFVAWVARHHRKAQPLLTNPDFAEMTRGDFERIRLLAGILRLAVGLNRTRQSRVKSIRVRFYSRRVNITVTPRGSRSLDVEMHKAGKERTNLERIFGQPVVLSAPGFREDGSGRRRKRRRVSSRLPRRNSASRSKRSVPKTRKRTGKKSHAGTKSTRRGKKPQSRR